MSDWAAVVLVLGLCALAVAVYAVRLVTLARYAAPEWRSERDAMVASIGTRIEVDQALDKRLSNVEKMLKVDGQRIMAEATRNTLPAVMR
jgi:hypothetical protein